MVNTCEPLINFVKAKQAKVADRLEPKGVQSVTPLHAWEYTDVMTAGVEAEPKLSK